MYFSLYYGVSCVTSTYFTKVSQWMFYIIENFHLKTEKTYKKTARFIFLLVNAIFWLHS